MRNIHYLDLKRNKINQEEKKMKIGVLTPMTPAPIKSL